jgi:hypothetical protein
MDLREIFSAGGFRQNPEFIREIGDCIYFMQSDE